MKTKVKKIIYHKLGLNDKIENKLRFYKKTKKKKEIKIISIEVKMSINKRTILNF